MPRWRILRSAPAPGPINMAVDEALLESAIHRDSPCTLRLYAWDPPCLSLGYGQSVDDVDFGLLEERGWDMVRRPTGGRAILHVDELTYAAVGNADDAWFGGGVLASYERLSAALAAALDSLGLRVESSATRGTQAEESPVCFENPGPFEIMAGGRKVVGSAQVRRKGSVLQHGSIPLRGDLGRICQVLRYGSRQERERATSAVRARAATLEESLGRPVVWERAADAVEGGFRTALGIEMEVGELSPEERSRAQELALQYADPEWNRDRRVEPPVPS